MSYRFSWKETNKREAVVADLETQTVIFEAWKGAGRVEISYYYYSFQSADRKGYPKVPGSHTALMRILLL